MAFYKRRDLQVISAGKLEDAVLLLKNRRFSNSYYLAGYAVEIGLKACIAKQFSREVIPDKKFVNDIFQHDLRRLISLAGLNSDLKKREDGDSAFAANWAVVAEWNPEIRYEGVDSYKAQTLLTAIAEPNKGILPWIQTHW